MPINYIQIISLIPQAFVAHILTFDLISCGNNDVFSIFSNYQINELIPNKAGEND